MNTAVTAGPSFPPCDEAHGSPSSPADAVEDESVILSSGTAVSNRIQARDEKSDVDGLAKSLGQANAFLQGNKRVRVKVHMPKHDVSSGNIFADLGLQNADELLLKSQIVGEISRLMKAKKLTQMKAATLTGTAQPDLSNLIRGRFNGFSIERLMLMLTGLGRDVEIPDKPTSKSRKTGGIKFRAEAA